MVAGLDRLAALLYDEKEQQENDMPTPSPAFLDGLRTGRAWNHDWRPGGPWVCGCKDPACPSAPSVNQEWLRGFDVGRSESR